MYVCVCACVCVQELLIEISDRHKDGPPVYYKLYGEVFMPSINVTDFPAIFEEHRVCKRLGVLGQHKFHEVAHNYVHHTHTHIHTYTYIINIHTYIYIYFEM